MSKIRGKRPSASLVISILALFVALGGSAYAASKIGSKDIKKNAITAAKIKKNAVTTTKLRNGAVTGAKIKESSLEPVPSAVNATNATTAAHFSRYFSSGLKRASAVQHLVLLTVGPFTFIGKCEETSSDEQVARIVLVTSQAGSNVWTYEHFGFPENNFNPGTEQQVDVGVRGAGSEVAFYGNPYTSFAAESADGATLIEGNANSAINAFGAQCAFEVHGFNNG